MKPKVILLSGKRYVGKDYCAGDLADKLITIHKNTLIVSLADKVKQEYCELMNKDYWRLHQDRQYKEENRPAIVEYATTERAKDPLIWCKKLTTYIEKLSSFYEFFIISDIRYPNEINYFNSLYDAVNVRIHADDITRTGRGYIKNPVDQDETEVSLDNFKFDIYVDNSNNKMMNLDIVFNYFIDTHDKSI
uniref:Phosphomevalonate kinase n=1 Tax=Megaviridae environmental sample TaxID=1737588 RepID=A0A5J6VIR0_9VIRU|nr:MAG: phosphomevalonate kinase [Megaviridae environmental sample]